MIAIDVAAKEFVRLLDVAIKITEKMKADSSDALIVGYAGVTIENLNSFRNMAIAGLLPRPSRREVPLGTGLGLIRGIGEWTDDDDLLDAVYAAESYYKKSM